MISILFPAVLLAGTQLLRAQHVDSLERILARPNLSTAERIQTLYLLSRDLTYVDHARSLDYANRSLTLAASIDDRKGMAYAYRILGSIYGISNNYFSSMQYLHKALDLFEQQQDSAGIANCYISLGHIYRRLGKKEEETRYHRLSLEWFDRLDQPSRVGVAAHNLGETYYRTGELEKARELTLRAVRINDSLNNGAVLSNCYKVLGLIDLAEHRMDLAREHFLTALRINQGLGEGSQKIASAESLLRLAEISRDQEDWDSERAYLKQAVRFCSQHNLATYQAKANFELALFHARNQETAQSLYYMERHKALQDSIQAHQTADLAHLTQGMLDIDRLSAAATEYQQQVAETSRQLGNRNLILGLSAIFVLVLMVVLFQLWRLFREVRSRNETIRAQKKELEELNAAKDKFFSIVAHDLRSPLGSFKSFTEILVRQSEDLTPMELRQMGEMLDNSVTDTLRLADNLILWAQSQMDVLSSQHQHFDLAPVIENIVSVYKGVADRKGIRLDLKFTEKRSLYGDPNQVEFAIRNLVNNAIKYTPEGGTVTLTVEPAAGNKTGIRITDSGIGMDAGLLKDLFKVRAKASRRGTAGEKGSGLGLVLVREFVSRNHGEISVESVPQQGTSFTLTFSQMEKAA